MSDPTPSPQEKADSGVKDLVSFPTLLNGIASSLENFASGIRDQIEQFESVETEDRLARELFVGMVAHELRTPVVALRSRLEMLAKEVTTQKARTMVDQLLESCDDLVQISSDLLDFNKIRAGELSLLAAPFMPRSLLHRIHDDQSAISANIGTEFHLDVQGNMSAWRKGDRHRLLQILSNILGNAQKFAAKGTVVLRSDFSDSREIRFEVQDDGPGMTQEQVESLFIPFQQKATSPDTAHLGTGLGMTVVHHLVDLMDGEIAVESARGQGTTVRLRLPLAVCEAPDSPAMTSAAPVSEPAPSLVGKSLLHVDDDRLQGDVVRELLRPTGIRVVRAGTVEEALNLYRRRSFDYVITDLYLSDGTGIDVISDVRRLEARRMSPPARIMVVSAAVPEQVKAELDGLGIDACQLKPLRRQTLFDFLIRPATDMPPTA